MVPNISEKDEDALRTILEYCNNTAQHIEEFGDTFEEFARNLAFQESCSFDAIQIGEAANKLSDEYKESHPEIPWHQAVGLRNAVAHAYGYIDLGVLWETITEDFPRLKRFCENELGLESNQ